MKASFRLILATLAATVTLVGCVQEITPPNFENDEVNPAAEGSRVIAVSFGQQTKTYLGNDGFQPKFSPNDSILISNGEAIDTCEVDVNGDNATITTNLTGPLTAVYPYTAAKMNASNLNQIDTVLVSTVQSGKFADANICMAKMKGGKDESLFFENKTAVFCIYPPTDNPEYVEVSADGIEIANDVPTGSAHTSLEIIHVSTTTADSVYVSILVPKNLTVGNLTFSDGTKVKTVTDAKASTEIEAGALYTVTNEGWKSPEADIPDGALKGVFSVSTTKKVHFSKGNLQAAYDSSTSTYTWGFAANQYDYIGDAAGNTTIDSQTNGAVVDLFGWSTASTTYGINTSTDNSNYSGNFVDWGKAYCESKSITPDNIWRTLSQDEWVHLFNNRTVNGSTGEGYSYQRATINSDATGVYGMILYHDNYTGTAKASYTSDEWVSLENEGCVFLPAAGRRDGSDVDGVGGYGGYWSSSATDEYAAYGVGFEVALVTPDGSDYRNFGCSVRLVTNVSAAPTPEQSLVLGPDMIITKMRNGEPKPGIDNVTYPWIEYVNPTSEPLDDGTAEVQQSNRWTNLHPETGEIGDWIQVTGKNGSVNSPVLSPTWGKYLIFSVRNVYCMQVFATGSASGTADDGNCLKLTATSDDGEVIEASSTPGGIYGKGIASDFCTINLNPKKSYKVKVEAAVKDIQILGIKLINEIP